MSESKAKPESVSPAAVSPAAVSPAAVKPSAKIKKSRKRRLFRWLIILSCAAIIGRISLSLAIPPLIRMGTDMIGLEADWDALSLTLLTGDLKVQHFTLTNPRNGRQVAHLEHLSVDLDISALFTGTLRAHRLVIDGLDLDVQIDKNGNFVDIELPGATAANPELAPIAEEIIQSEATTDEVALNLTLPFEVDALRIQNVEVHLHDASVKPVLDTRLDLDVRISDLGSPYRPARLSVNLRCPKVIEVLRIEGEGDSSGRQLETKLTISAHGIQPHSIGDYLRPIGIAPAAHQISFEAELEARCAPVENDEIRATGMAKLHKVKLIADGEEELALDAIDLKIANFTSQRLEIQHLKVNGVRGGAERLANEALRIAGIDLLLAGDSDETAADPATTVSKATAPDPSPSAADTAAPAAPSAVPPAVPPAVPSAEPSAFIFELRETRFQDWDFTFVDSAYPQAIELAFQVKSLELDNLIVDAKRPDAECRFSTKIKLPGICDEITLTGTGTLFDTAPNFGLEFGMTGLKPDAIAPYLEASGIRSEFKSGSVTSKVKLTIREDDAGPVLDLEINDTGIRDGDQEHLALEAIHLRGLQLNALADGLVTESILIQGIQLPTVRDERGDIHSLGIVTKSPPKALHGVAQKPLPPLPFTHLIIQAIPFSESGLPKIFVQSIRSLGHRLKFHDASMDPSVDLAIDTFSLEVNDFNLGGAVPGESKATGSLALGIPGLCEDMKLKFTSTHSSGASKIDSTLKLDAQGIHTAGIKPYLDLAEINSLLQSAAFGMTVNATFSQQDDGLIANATINELSCIDGDTTLVALQSIEVKNVLISPSQVLIDQVLIDSPSIDIKRDAAGALHVLGLKIPLQTAAPDSAAQDTARMATAETDKTAEQKAGSETLENKTPEQKPETRVLVEPPVTAKADPKAASPKAANPKAANPKTAAPKTVDERGNKPAKPTEVTLKHLALRGAEIRWRDETLTTPVSTAIQVQADLRHLALADPDKPAEFEVELALVGQVDSATITGQLSAYPKHPFIHSRFRAQGIRSGPLRAYLPPGVKLELNDATLHADLDVDLTETEHGYAAELQIREVAFRDGSHEWFGIDQVTIRAPRLDHEQIEIGTFAITNARMLLRATNDGAIHAFGVQLENQGKYALVDQTSTVPAATGPAVTGPAAKVPTSTASTNTLPTAKRSVAPRTEQPTKPLAATKPAKTKTQTHSIRPPDLPTILFDGIDLDFHATVEVEHADKTSTLVHSEVRINNPKLITIWDGSKDDFDPWQIHIHAAADGILPSADLDISIAPYDPDPEISLKLMLQGISGQRLAEIAPGLHARIDASKLEDGSLEAQALIRLQMRRRHLLDFDTSRSFGLTAEVKDLAFRGQKDGKILFGIDELDLSVKGIDLEGQKVHVQSIEIAKPHLHIEKSEAGLHLLGVTIKLPDAEASAPNPEEAKVLSKSEQETSTEQETGQPALEGKPRLASSETAPTAPALDLQIDEILVTELDFRYLDSSVKPALDMPIQQLDVLIRNLSTRALSETIPIAFDIFVGGGKAQILDHLPEETFFGGLAKGALRTVTGSRERGTSERAVFDEFSLTGRLSVFPELRGTATVNLSNFELLTLRGLLLDAGIEVGDGSLDAGIQIRFHGENSTAIDSSFTFDRLSLKEGSDGPVRRWLKLSAPLDVIIFLLRNNAGELDLPLAFTVESGNLGTGQVLGAFTTALSAAIAKAVAAAPFRLVGSVTELIGLSGHAAEDLTQDTVQIPYGPATTLVTANNRERIKPLLDKLDDDEDLVIVLQHELGRKDVARAEVLANPTPEECHQISTGLRARRNTLTRERTELAAKARAFFAIGHKLGAEHITNQLRHIDSELGATETQLDLILEILRPNANRRRGKRTKQASLEIAQKRLDEVRDYLESAGIESHRIDMRRPHYRSEQEGDDGRVTLTPKRRRAR